MKRSLTTDILFVLLLFSITACEKQKASYFPLEPGLEWRYNVIKTTRDGVERQKYIFINLDEREVNGQVVTARRFMDGALLFYRETDEGVLYTGKMFKTGMDVSVENEASFVFHYPLEQGNEWEELTTTKLLKKTGPPQKTVFIITANISVKVTVAAVDDTVKVPAGTFTHCIRIEKKGSDFVNAGNYIGLTVVRVKETSWYAPGVGLVKSMREEKTDKKALDKGTQIIELEAFSS